MPIDLDVVKNYNTNAVIYQIHTDLPIQSSSSLCGYYAMYFVRLFLHHANSFKKYLDLLVPENDEKKNVEQNINTLTYYLNSEEF